MLGCVWKFKLGRELMVIYRKPLKRSEVKAELVNFPWTGEVMGWPHRSTEEEKPFSSLDYKRKGWDRTYAFVTQLFRLQNKLDQNFFGLQWNTTEILHCKNIIQNKNRSTSAASYHLPLIRTELPIDKVALKSVGFYKELRKVDVSHISFLGKIHDEHWCI